MKLNLAQRVMIALGVDPILIITRKDNTGRRPSFTKKGPGRAHRQGGARA